jgi:hypothetical protein
LSKRWPLVTGACTSLVFAYGVYVKYIAPIVHLPAEVQALKEMVAEKNELALHVLASDFYSLANKSPSESTVRELQEAINRLEESKRFASRLVSETVDVRADDEADKAVDYARRAAGVSLGLAVLREYLGAFIEDSDYGDTDAVAMARKDRQLFLHGRLADAYVAIEKIEVNHDLQAYGRELPAKECMEAVRHVSYPNAYRYKELFLGTLKLKEYEASRREVAAAIRGQGSGDVGGIARNSRVPRALSPSTATEGQWEKMLGQSIGHLERARNEVDGRRVGGEPDLRRAITNLAAAHVDRARVLMQPLFLGKDLVKEKRDTAYRDLEKARQTTDISARQLWSESDARRISIVRANHAESLGLLAMLEADEEARRTSLRGAVKTLDDALSDPQNCHECVYAMRGHVKAMQYLLAAGEGEDVSRVIDEILGYLDDATNRGFAWNSTSAFECMEQYGELRALQIASKEPGKFEASLEAAMRGVYRRPPGGAK